MVTALAAIAVFIYVVAGFAWLTGRVTLRPQFLARVAAAFHVFALAWVASDTAGFASFASSLSAVGFLLAFATLVLPGPRLDVVRAGLVLTGAFGLAASLFVPHSEIGTLRDVGSSFWLPPHVAFVFVGLASLVAEFGLSVVEAVTKRRLKSKQLDALARLPSLDAVAKLRLRALGTGVLSLAIGVSFGGMWAASTMSHEAWLASPKVWFTLVVWLWYAVALGVHRLSRGHARYALVWSAVGLAGLLFGFVGLDFITGGFHAYGG